MSEQLDLVHFMLLLLLFWLRDFKKMKKSEHVFAYLKRNFSIVPGAWEEPERGNQVKLEQLCPSYGHVQPPNYTPPALSPHYLETLRSCDPIYQPLLPIHLLSQMHRGRLHKKQSIHHLWVVRSFSFIPFAHSTTVFPIGRDSSSMWGWWL